MSVTDDLPTDSVLRRHAITERNRAAGLPPTDAVLRRHHDQWMSVLLATPPAFAPAAPAGAAAFASPKPVAAKPVAPAAAAPTAAAPTPAAASARAGAGGLFGWLRRLFGG